MSYVRRRVVPRTAVALTFGAALALVFTTALAVPMSALARAQRLGSRVLHQGMSGPDVMALQRDLTRVGVPTPAVGRFGPATKRTVRRFERQYRLAVDGIVRPSFVRELKVLLATGSHSVAVANARSAAGGGSGGSGIGGSTTATKPTKGKVSSGTNSRHTATVPVVKQNGGSAHLGERTLRQGMHGHDVRVLQGYLTLVGYPTTVDGHFGSSTVSNVIAFESAHGLKANGVVTYDDQLALRQAVASAQAGGAVSNATINPDGTATAPAGAPAVVQSVIASANQIIGKPYVYAGGHQKWNDVGYDCSGAVSYALHGAGLLSTSEDSTGLESYGSSGPGKWITIYADPSHTWVVVAGIAFDTANYGGPNIPSGTGPRWRTNPTGNLADGGNYVVRHPTGL